MVENTFRMKLLIGQLDCLRSTQFLCTGGGNATPEAHGMELYCQGLALNNVVGVRWAVIELKGESVCVDFQSPRSEVMGVGDVASKDTKVKVGLP